MKRRLSCLTVVCLCAVLGCGKETPPAEKPRSDPGKPAVGAGLPDGFYIIHREGAGAAALGPLADDETVAVQEYRYLKEKQAPVYLVVRTQPDVALVLARPPVREEEGGLRILLELTPAGAKDLERVTAANKDGAAALVLGGEVITTHKIRTAITGGKLQITNCDPDAGEHLWRTMQRLHGK